MLPAHKAGFTVWHVWQFPMLCGDWVVGCLLIVWTRICIVSFALVAKVEPACTTAPLLQASHSALLANAVLTVWSLVCDALLQWFSNNQKGSEAGWSVLAEIALHLRQNAWAAIAVVLICRLLPGSNVNPAAEPL